MSAKNQRTRFGQLLEQYRNDRELTQLKLERLLDQSGYPITNGMVSKYEYGKINPHPAFIHSVAKCMELSKEEADALIEAHLADISLKFWKKYRDVSGQEED